MAAQFWERNTSSKAQKRIAKIAKQVGADAKTMNVVFNASFDLDDNNMGWIRNDDTPEDAIEHAVSTGFIPPAFSLTPEKAIARLVAARDKLNHKLVASAFASSLVDGRPDYRSILGTYACFYRLDERHLLDAWKSKEGLTGLQKEDQSEEYYPHQVVFTKFFRANSMEHDSVVDAILEFESFVDVCEVDATQGMELLRNALSAIRKLPDEAQLSELVKAIQGIFKGSKMDRQHVLETFGYCDILKPKSQPPFLGKYNRLGSCPLPNNNYKKEWRYPVCWWSGEDGLNEEAVSFWFPEL